MSEREDPAIAEQTRQIIQEINACSPGQPLAAVPTLFAFGPIYRALAALTARCQQVEQERNNFETRLNQWRNWAQFVFAKGGTPEGSDQELQWEVAAAADRDAANAREAAEARALQAEQARDALRAALTGLVGANTRSELEQMEAAIRATPAPAADKAASIDAIHALLATEV